MTGRRFPAVVHRSDGRLEEVTAVLEDSHVRFDPPLTLGPQESVALPPALVEVVAADQLGDWWWR